MYACMPIYFKVVDLHICKLSPNTSEAIKNKNKKDLALVI